MENTKKIIIIALILVATLLLAGCNQEEQSTYFNLDEEFSVTENQVYLTYLSRSTLKLELGFDSFSNSGACPENTQCIWDGEQGVKIKVTKNDYYENKEEEQIYLSEKTKPKVIALGFEFELVSIDTEKKEATIIVSLEKVEGVMSVSELASTPEKYSNKEVKVIGLLERGTCNKNGCDPNKKCCSLCYGKLFDINNKETSIEVHGMDCAFSSIPGYHEDSDEPTILEGVFQGPTSINTYYLNLKTPEENPPNENLKWFSINPIQCKGNAWEEWHDSLSRQYFMAPTEEEIMIEWLSTVHGVEIKEFASKQFYEDVCTACDCPRGDIIAVLVDSSNSKKMIELGWEKMELIGCQEDAKVCSNESVVVRQAPFCEFPECK